MAKRMAECHPDKPHWARGFCGTCYQRWWNEQNPGATRARIKARKNPATCHPEKQELARGLCNTCYRRWWRKENPDKNWKAQNEYQKRRYAQKPASERRAIMMRRYGLTVADYDQMFESQSGVCAICKTDTSPKPLQVDHCHATETVRALLCGHCNSALGHARDNVDRLKSMIDYLEHHSAESSAVSPAGRS